MGAMKKLAMIPLAGLALACGRSEQTRQDQALNSALRSDLERAAAPTSALASADFTPTRVVSAIELGESPAAHAPERTAAPARRATPRVKAEPAAAPTVVPMSSSDPEPAPEPVLVAVVPDPGAEPATAPVTRPTAGARPTPNPVDYPAPQPRANGGMDPMIGVVIRGGSIGDDDHCEIHHGRIPIMINQRAPVIRMTFPRGGW